MKRIRKRTIVRVSLRQANLKRRLRRQLAALGFHRSKDGSLEAAGTGKDVIRALHNAQRNARLEVEPSVRPAKVRPQLFLVGSRGCPDSGAHAIIATIATATEKGFHHDQASTRGIRSFGFVREVRTCGAMRRGLQRLHR
jgi:hypothetical protein